jgi:hypothetical protein
MPFENQAKQKQRKQHLAMQKSRGLPTVDSDKTALQLTTFVERSSFDLLALVFSV